MNYVVYTDGSCLGNPGAGGWAAVMIDRETGEFKELSGGAARTTNNRMEMTAALEALRTSTVGSSIEVFTDSQYLRNAFEKGWLVNWKRRGWVTSSGTPVLNQDLWSELDELMMTRDVKFNWVRGHVGDQFNEHCDQLARAQAKRFQSGRRR
ncbi:MAG: ribonuclease HI [Selenomonadaceae bacterium]|nr:ribonuclease HI [Selenomonadaceae bacterium]